MEPAPAPSFVARVHGLVELQQRASVLETRLATALRRIMALANEDERIAIRDGLRELTGDAEQLAARTRGARTRGDDPAALARIEHQLAEADIMLGKLREGLRYARTVDELAALEQRGAEPPAPIHHAFDDYDRIDVVMSPVPSPTLSWRRGVVDLP